METSRTSRLPALVVIAGRREARLARCERLSSGRVHVDIVSRLSEAWDPARHENPPSRSDAAGHVFENRGHQDGERIHRFAREIVAWLGRERQQLPGHVLAVAAEPALLGALRAEAPAALLASWIEHGVDLAGLSPGGRRSATCCRRRPPQRTRVNGVDGPLACLTRATWTKESASRAMRRLDERCVNRIARARERTSADWRVLLQSRAREWRRS